MHQQGRVRPIRVAIVGAGMIAGVHRRSAVLAGATVIGVLASTPARSAEVAASWGVPEAYSSIDDVASSRADVVHVTSPNATHAPYVTALLQAGKHVVCEKPLGLTLSEAAAMTAQATSAGVVATVPFVYRYHPLVREIRDRARLGEFGRWNLLHGSYLQDWLLSPDTSNWRVDPAEGGASRAFADIGSHWCDLVEWVSGERLAAVSAQRAVAVAERPSASSVSFSGPATTETPRVPVRTEDSAVVLFRTMSGVPGSVVVSQVSAGRRNRLWFELDGSHGSTVFDQENPEQIWLAGQDGVRLIARDPARGSAEQRRLSTLPAGHAQGYAHCFDAFVADTYSAFAGEKPEGLPTFSDGLRAAHVVDAVLRSADTGAWTGVPQHRWPSALDGGAPNALNVTQPSDEDKTWYSE